MLKNPCQCLTMNGKRTAVNGVLTVSGTGPVSVNQSIVSTAPIIKSVVSQKDKQILMKRLFLKKFFTVPSSLRFAL